MGNAIDVQKFIRSLKQDYQPKAREAAARAVDRFSHHVLGEAQVLCPVDTGALKASATATDPVDNNALITQEIGFNTNYAAAVHERLDVHHPNGQAKFLETAMRANAAKFSDYVIAEINKAVG